MTSSSSYELILRQGGKVLGAVAAPEIDPAAEASAGAELDGTRSFEVMIRRPRAGTFGCLRLGDTILLSLPPSVTERSIEFAPIRDDFGDAAFTFAEHGEDEEAPARVLLTLWAMVRAEPIVEELYETLISELERVHAGLAQDVLGRTTHRRGAGRGVPLDPGETLRRLTEIASTLDRALDEIATQPSVSLDRRTERAIWRPKDIIPAGRLGDLAREVGTVFDNGRVVAVARARVLRTHISTDLPEHRQIREGLLHLARRSRLLALHCERAADTYEVERGRWGRTLDGNPSVFDVRFLPRVRALRSWALAAQELSRSADQLLRRHRFVSSSSAARTRLEPTPLFLSRPGYREAYHALRSAQAIGEVTLLGDDFRVRYRRLSELYEYWTFVRAVSFIRERADVGPPEPKDAFSVIDDVYRPELQPGQSFRFPWTSGRFITVTYEPEFPPVWDSGPARFRATLGTGTLRPDITIEVVRPGEPPTVLVLDAKSHREFTHDTFWEVTDYRTRICDPTTGHQPVRQVVLLHRDTRRPHSFNLPGYLEGRVGDRTSSVLGAVCLLPDRQTSARRVIERFLAVFG